MKLTFKERSNYGRVLIYPVCDKAIIFANLLNVTTLNATQLTYIAQLGYQIEIKPLP